MLAGMERRWDSSATKSSQDMSITAKPGIYHNILSNRENLAIDQIFFDEIPALKMAIENNFSPTRSKMQVIYLCSENASHTA